MVAARDGVGIPIATGKLQRDPKTGLWEREGVTTYPNSELDPVKHASPSALPTTWTEPDASQLLSDEYLER